jgi:hypothetical protein
MDLLEKLKQEARVIKSAPFSFLLFIVIGGSIGYVASSWYYSKQIMDREQDIRRYRTALGIDKGAASAMVELNNAELKAKALNSASKARDLCFAFKRRESQIKPPTKGNKKEEKEAAARDLALMKETSQEFDRDLKADFLNANNEVMRRLDPKYVSAVTRAPIISNAETGVPIGMLSLMPGDFEAAFLCIYADQLEQMAKLLPSDSGTPKQ